MIHWCSVEDLLPEDKEVVLIYEPNTNVFFSPQVRSRMHVAQFTRGRVPEPGETIYWADQHSNNTVPYRWNGDGPCDWNGQEVTHWARLESPEDSDVEIWR